MGTLTLAWETLNWATAVAALGAAVMMVWVGLGIVTFVLVARLSRLMDWIIPDDADFPMFLRFWPLCICMSLGMMLMHFPLKLLGFKSSIRQRIFRLAGIKKT